MEAVHNMITGYNAMLAEISRRGWQIVIDDSGETWDVANLDLNPEDHTDYAIDGDAVVALDADGYRRHTLYTLVQ